MPLRAPTAKTGFVTRKAYQRDLGTLVDKLVALHERQVADLQAVIDGERIARATIEGRISALEAMLSAAIGAKGRSR